MRLRPVVVLLVTLALLAIATAPAPALDLETALRDVAARHPMLAARREMTAAARRKAVGVGAWESPMLELGAQNVPVGGGFDRDPMTMKMAMVSQRVPVFGANRLAVRSARAAASADSAAARWTLYELLGAAWAAYADAHYGARLAAGARAHLAVAERMVASARARYESGSGRLEDVLRAEAERARIRADLASYAGEERAARARLAALRGGVETDAGDSLAGLPAVTIAAEPAAWLGSLGAGHPRLGELGARAASYRIAARAARRMLWPDLELRGAYGKRETLADGTPQDDMFSAAAGLMLPLLGGPRQRAEAAEMEAMARATDHERRAAELELRQEVEGAHASALASQRAALLLADTVVVTQRRALEASWAAYTAGSADLWRVLEAAHTLYLEEIALVRARQELARAQSRLLALTGRGDLLGVALPEPERN